MPIYKNRPAMPPNTVVRRHLSLDGLVKTLHTETLRLTRVDRFEDPFEGSIPLKQYEDPLPLFSGNSSFFDGGMNGGPNSRRDPWTTVSSQRRAGTRSAHASCWSAGDESEAMWRLYCGDDGVQGRGVAIETTLGALDFIAESRGLFVSPINYRHYHSGGTFTDDMDAFMHKRWGFRHEAEVRLLLFNTAHYFAHVGAIREGSQTPSELPEHVFVDWPTRATSERLVISPYAGKGYASRVRAKLAAIDDELLRKLEFSVLSEHRFKVIF